MTPKMASEACKKYQETRYSIPWYKSRYESEMIVSAIE